MPITQQAVKKIDGKNALVKTIYVTVLWVKKKNKKQKTRTICLQNQVQIQQMFNQNGDKQ